jgi:formylmethanofuran dehydrogenase subunit E
MPKGIYIHKPFPEERKKKISEAMKGHITSKETKKKISEGNKGKFVSEETKKKLSKVHKGRKFSEEHKKKLSKAHKGSKHWNWQGGKSFEPYSPAFTKELKEAIRQRDNFTCAICGEYPAFDVHHIDYDKQNCEPENLITLCKSCHAKTNSNREYWTKYFLGGKK